MDNLQKGDYIYYAQIFKPPIGEYNVLELKVHTVNEEYKYITGCDVNKSKQTYIFNFSDWGKVIFDNPKEALKLVKEAEKTFGKVIKHKDIISEED